MRYEVNTVMQSAAPLRGKDASDSDLVLQLYILIPTRVGSHIGAAMVQRASLPPKRKECRLGQILHQLCHTERSSTRWAQASCILAEGAIALSVTLSGGALFAS